MTLITKAPFIKINRTKEHGPVQLTLDILHFIHWSHTCHCRNWMYLRNGWCYSFHVHISSQRGWSRELTRASQHLSGLTCLCSRGLQCCSYITLWPLQPTAAAWAGTGHKIRYNWSELGQSQGLSLSLSSCLVTVNQVRDSEVFNHVDSRIWKDRYIQISKKNPVIYVVLCIYFYIQCIVLIKGGVYTYIYIPHIAFCAVGCCIYFLLQPATSHAYFK